MADSYLAVRTVDVTEAPLAATSVVANFDGGADVALSKVDRGIVEVLIPAGATKVHVQVTPPSPFWPATQDVVVDTTTSPPSVTLDGGQQLNTRMVRVVTRGADFNLEVHFVVGQLLDVTSTVPQTAAGFGVTYDTPARSIRRFSTPILNESGSGQTLLNASLASVQFRGKVFFAARQNTPKLVVFAHPGWNKPANPQQARLPIPFHVFYHPAIPWNDTYPNGYDYLDFVSRYLFKPISDGGKAMIYQNNADTLKNVFVFPVGNPGEWMGEVAGQPGLYRLLQEAAFYLQRMQGIAYPLQPVGSASLSCFSAGVRPMASVIMGPRVPAFFNRALRNVFVFDGVFAGSSGSSETVAFCSALGRWFQNGAGGRSLRVYTQSRLWYDELQKYVNIPLSAKAPGDAREADGSACTLLNATTPFWGALGGIDYWGAHQYIPALFMEHAVTNSTFSG